MIRVLTICCIGLAIVNASTLVKRSPQMPSPPPMPGDLPMPPMLSRVARQAPPPPPGGAPQRFVRQAPPPPPDQLYQSFGSDLDASNVYAAVGSMFPSRNRREARGGGGHMPTKTG